MGKKTSVPPTDGESKIEIFRNTKVRKVYYRNEWWFALNDVIVTLTESADPTQYLKKLRSRDEELALLFNPNPVDKGGVQIVPPLMLEVETAGGPQSTLCWNIEGIFRLIQSLRSKKAEPFKKWLAKVGFERLQEIENPELAVKRAIALYKSKGYPDDWIENRITNKASRITLAAVWKEHGMERSHHIAILTDAVSIEALGITTNNHKEMKGLLGQNLRDHMTPLELTLMTLGEQATTEIVRAKNPKGLAAHEDVATTGGGIAGKARKEIEEASGRPVISPTNFLTPRQQANIAKKLAEQISNVDDTPQVAAG